MEKAFHEHGINYFYWSTPRRKTFGDGLRNLIKDHREEIVIVLQSYDHMGITVKRAVNKGLKSLGIDYADVVLLGWHNFGPPKKVLNGAAELKEKGLVKYIGMSGHKRSLFSEHAQNADSPIDIFMLRYNAVHSGAENDVFPSLPEQNKPGITIYTATCWGKLMKPKLMPEGEKPVSAVDAYRFVLSNPNVDLCMMGPKNDEQFEENVKAMKMGPLSDDEMARIRRIGEYIYRK